MTRTKSDPCHATDPRLNAEQIREVLEAAIKEAGRGERLVKFNGVRSFLWVACADGSLRLDFLWKGCRRSDVERTVRDGFMNCTIIGRG
jgi:hypothetical protein